MPQAISKKRPRLSATAGGVMAIVNAADKARRRSAFAVGRAGECLLFGEDLKRRCAHAPLARTSITVVISDVGHPT